MVKAKRAGGKKPAAAKQVRHARIELSPEDYERMRRVAKASGLAMAAYIRQAVLKQIRRDESEGSDNR